MVETVLILSGIEIPIVDESWNRYPRLVFTDYPVGDEKVYDGLTSELDLIANDGNDRYSSHYTSRALIISNNDKEVPKKWIYPKSLFKFHTVIEW